MQHVVSEKYNNKISHDSRSVNRDRKMGPASIQQYQTERRYWCEKSL